MMKRAEGTVNMIARGERAFFEAVYCGNYCSGRPQKIYGSDDGLWGTEGAAVSALESTARLDGLGIGVLVGDGYGGGTRNRGDMLSYDYSAEVA